MKMIKLLLISAIAINTASSQGHSDSLPAQERLYFGQKPPQLTPEIFAPGIVSVEGRYEGGVSFSPDLNDMYFSSVLGGQSVVYHSKLEGNTWTPLRAANFTEGAVKDEFAPFVSHNGKRVYFSTYSTKYPLKIWYVERSKNSWGNAVLLDSPVNDTGAIVTSEAQNGDLFYVNDSKKKMYYAPNINGEFSETNQVDIDYGSLGFISSSQDFLLVEAHKENDEKKDKDIYVYFKEKDGVWSKPIGLGDSVNTNYREGRPTMTPDGKYLFFNRYNEANGNPNIYWVSAEIITQLKHAYLKR
jgi:hypothetical protein